MTAAPILSVLLALIAADATHIYLRDCITAGRPRVLVRFAKWVGVKR